MTSRHTRLLMKERKQARDHLREQLRTQTPLMIRKLIERGWTMRRMADVCGWSWLHLECIRLGKQRASMAVAYTIAGILAQETVQELEAVQ
jgi:hypothetical protein